MPQSSVPKMGTLTQNSMTVIAGSVGIHLKFICFFDENSLWMNAIETKSRFQELKLNAGNLSIFSIDQTKLNDVLPAELKELFNEANLTAFENE